MTTTLNSPPPAADGPILLHGVSWELYERLLDELEKSNQKMYLTYDHGKLEIMPPSPFNEKNKKIIGRLVELMAMEMSIPILALGSTTFKRESVSRGLEPDECYYIQHEPQVASRETIDLNEDPPPDLAIEMDYTHHPLDRENVYAGLGVPEIWQYDGKRLQGLGRNQDGKYDEIENSIAFPFLRLAEIERFLKLAKSTSQDQAVVAFRDWIRQTHGRKS